MPELLIPPLKLESVTDPRSAAVPPTKIPEYKVEIAPELLMPPAKVDIVTDAPRPVALPPT
jgi:hypothetical protein